MAARAKNIYTAAVIALGFSVFVLMNLFDPVRSVPSLVFLVLLSILAETQSVEFDKNNSVSVTSAVLICALLTLGPTAAAWAAAFSIIGSVTKINGRYKHIFNTKPWITFFNSSVYVLSIASCAGVFYLLGGRPLGISGMTFAGVIFHINDGAGALIAAIVVSTLVNTIVVGFYMSLKYRANAFEMWVSNLLWSVLGLVVVGLLGVIITAVFVSLGWFFVLLFYAPFMLARYVFIAYKDMQQNYLQTVQSLAAAIEAKDSYTIGHSKRVESICAVIASEMKLSEKRCSQLKYAALLHDIGKIGVDENILCKKGRLDDEEWAQIEQHPAMGVHIIKDISFLAEPAKIILAHHERYAGGGYPNNLKGDQIPLESMILSIADSYDAMTSKRPYGRLLTHEEAIEEIKKGSGTQYSPPVVEAFLRAVKRRNFPVGV